MLRNGRKNICQFRCITGDSELLREKKEYLLQTTCTV